ncbi:hypothetical protein PIB30_094995 [Stylosanthes scabra]|uniref:Uncharacterized protein n=1 Tax=Stylosanthes scabra TaxID=79078 RepID=A0ABU6UV44_9FABA|nr:hypothetical protein [Stylosanthes scabra]
MATSTRALPMAKPSVILKESSTKCKQKPNKLGAVYRRLSRRITGSSLLLVGGDRPRLCSFGVAHIYPDTTTTLDWMVYLKGDARQGECDWYGLLNEILELEYLGEPKNRTTHKDYQITEVNHSRRYEQFDPFILAQNARQEVLVMDEAYQNAEDIPVRIITDTEPPETLRSLTGEVDIVNAQLPNTENQDKSEVEEPNSEDNESAFVDSISTQDDE